MTPVHEPRPSGAIGVDDAVAAVSQAAGTAALETVSVSEALDRVLAKDLESLDDLPNHASSAMDGYACRARDTVDASPAVPLGLRVVGSAPAGHAYGGTLGPGAAVSIYTGAPLPDGADAVVRLEDVERRGDTVWLTAPADGHDVRRRAEQLRTGTTYLRKGTLMTPRAVLLAAAMGHGAVPVASRPRVLVVVTGDEVVRSPARPARGQVFDANGPSVAALAARAGGEVLEIHHAPDDLGSLARYLLHRAPGVDLILSVGGVSLGRFDVVHQLLHDHAKAERAFAGVLCRPGGPVSFGSFAGVPLLALPGNPVAAAITFQVLGLAWFHRRLGRSDPAPFLSRSTARAGGAFRHAGPKTGFWPANLAHDPASGATIVEPVDRGAPAGPSQLQRTDVLAITWPWASVDEGGRIEVMALA